MKIQMPVWKNAGPTAAILLIAAGSIPLSAGCSSKKSAAEISETSANLNSQKLPKLTAQEVDKKIQEVQANQTIPDSAKPNIIDSIRAQGQP